MKSKETLAGAKHSTMHRVGFGLASALIHHQRESSRPAASPLPRRQFFRPVKKTLDQGVRIRDRSRLGCDNDQHQVSNAQKSQHTRGNTRAGVEEDEIASDLERTKPTEPGTSVKPSGVFIPMEARLTPADGWAPVRP